MLTYVLGLLCWVIPVRLEIPTGFRFIDRYMNLDPLLGPQTNGGTRSNAKDTGTGCVGVRRGWFIASALFIGCLYLLSEVLLEVSSSSAMELAASAIGLIANAIIVALFAWGVSQRRGRFSPGDILDGLIMGLGGWLVAWIMLVQPYLDLNGESNINVVLNAAYLPMATPLIALAGGIVLSGLARRPATWLFVLAVVANVSGDAFYGTFEVGIASSWSATLASALYLIAFASTGAALLHPTSPELIGKSESHRRLKLPSRLTATGLILTVPITMMALVEST